MPKRIFLLVIAWLGCACIGVAQPRELLDSLWQATRTAPHDSLKMQANFQLATLYLNRGQTDSALTICQRATQIAESIGNTFWKGRCLGTIGRIYIAKGDFALALSYSNQSLAVFTELGDSTKIASLLNNIGMVYESQGDYPRALDFYTRCLRIRQALGDWAEGAVTLNTIGVLYAKQHDYERALANFRQSLHLRDSIGDQGGVAACHVNIGQIFEIENKITEALAEYEKAVTIGQDINEPRYIAAGLAGIGGIYMGQGNLPKALEFIQRGLEIKKTMGDKYGMASSYNDLSALYLLLDNPVQARKMAESAMQLGVEIGSLERKSQAVLHLAQADSALGNWQSAFANFKLYKLYNDSMFNESNAAEIGRLEARHEIEIAQAEEQARALAIAQQLAEERQRSNNLQYLGIVAVLAILLLGLRFLRKAQLPNWLVNGLVFTAFLMLFEFISILADPWVEAYTGGVPLPKLAINLGMAAIFTPLHGWLQRSLAKPKPDISND